MMLTALALTAVAANQRAPQAGSPLPNLRLAPLVAWLPTAADYTLAGPMQATTATNAVDLGLTDAKKTKAFRSVDRLAFFKAIGADPKLGAEVKSPTDKAKGLKAAAEAKADLLGVIWLRSADYGQTAKGMYASVKGKLYLTSVKTGKMVVDGKEITGLATQYGEGLKTDSPNGRLAGYDLATRVLPATFAELVKPGAY